MYVTLEIIIASSTWNSDHCQSHPSAVAVVEAVRALVQLEVGNPVEEAIVAADSLDPEPMIAIVHKAQPLAEIDALAAAERFRAAWVNRSRAARQRADDAKAVVFHMFHPKF